ncbi:uncharacterized protein LOC132950725 [Metopolophium dirhodum]|uniref:uncharacterized protein LOC132950725 n=1 Tax=Metopolophium dirhodum TaxID=44670 RepID=UPI00298FB83C|nr:uncharacterized protein LOC132950725 [Metopolophium dirhodum]
MDKKSVFSIFNIKKLYQVLLLKKISKKTMMVDSFGSGSVTTLLEENANLLSNSQTCTDPQINSFQSNTRVNDLGDIDSGPAKPILEKYPQTQFGSQKRGFSPTVYTRFDWIEYSVVEDAIFCYPCRIFGCRTVAKMEFSTKGFRNCKKIFGSRGIGLKYTKSKLELYSSCQYHLTCMTKWHAHIQSKTTGSVHTLVTNAHRDKILENRDYMLTLIDIILFLAHQGVAFRGHIENETSLNQGNLKEACKLMAKYNPTFALNYAKPTNHTSWLIQNEIIEICAKHVRNTIVEDIISAGMYSVSCDEAR